MTGSENGGQGPPDDGTETEEAERCPICLGILAGDVAMPGGCCHLFCLRCLLTWAESQMVPSCPVDRRPFDNVYKWDPTQACVQIAVRKQASQPEVERCICRSLEPVCLKSKPGRRLRKQKAERTTDAKPKGLVRKCSDEDPSSMTRKKVRESHCCAWSPSQYGFSLGSLTQEIVEPLWEEVEVSYEAGNWQCKPQKQECPWLSPAAPIPASGNSRHSSQPLNWNHSPFPLRPFTAPFNPTTPFGPSHFVFQGRVCAVTCPKGGEKRGGRASGSKAPPKETAPVTSRRSSRNAKAQEQAPVSDPGSPPVSNISDSDSSSGQPTKSGKASQVPGKRKGRNWTNRKASGKRKAPLKRKVSPQVVNSPTASEEEEEEEREDNEKGDDDDDDYDGGDDEQNMKSLESPLSDAEGSPDAGSPDAGSPDVGSPDAGSPDAGSPDVGSPDPGSPDVGSPDVGSPDAGSPDAGSPDAGSPDAGSPDAGSPDAGSPDAGSPDAGSPDAGSPDVGSPDVGSPDVGSPDAGSPDAGSPDAGSPDVGSPDVGSPDVGSPDAGSPDAGSPDAGSPDAGSPDAESPDAESPDAESPDAVCQTASSDQQTDVEPPAIDPDESQEQSEEPEQKPGEEEGDGSMSLLSVSPPCCPGVTSEGDCGDGQEEQPGSPDSSVEKESGKRNSPLPSDFLNGLLESPRSLYSSQEDQRDPMEISGSPEGKGEASSKEENTEPCESSLQPGSPSAGESHRGPNAPEDTETETLGPEEPSVKETPEEAPKEKNPSEDDTNVIPMVCSSPDSDHADKVTLEPPSDIVPLANMVPPAQTGLPTKEQDNGSQEKPRERSQERKNGRQRRSRFHSPTSSWSPKRDSGRDSSRRSRSRERSQERDGSPATRRSSQARSRERDRDREGERLRARGRDREREEERERERDTERDYSRRDWSRDRRRRRSRSRSNSRSRSRSRAHRWGSSPTQPASREPSPQRKEHWGRGGWRTGQSSDSRRLHGGTGRFENDALAETSPDHQARSNNPDWVTERTCNDAGQGGGARWRAGGVSGWGRGRGGGGAVQAGSNRSFYSQQGETTDSRWQPRNNFSGNNSVNDVHDRFNENRGAGWRKDLEFGDSMLDRSGWSSASSWAVRRTLPADVQDYYSRRERGGGWNRQEEDQTPTTEPLKNEPVPQAVPGNAPVPVVNLAPPQLNVLHHHFPMSGPRGALPISLQPAAPYPMPPQLPMHLHPAVPLLQVPAVGAQGLPPPPPPPPPTQPGSQTAAGQPNGHTAQMAGSMMAYGKPPLMATPVKAGGVAATQGQPPSNQAPSSTTQPGQHNKALADSSKKEKKQQIQEKAINEVKTAIKPYYQKKEITKDEYKEIVRKAVEKVCHSKSGEVNSAKVANLVKAYVDKYKHARKK
ncbi:protein SCAF11 [Lampris incognitus]|uniref:protein SCAF11 n=1 Tax=Lampris incognitus TaxID=2546036 RepID=UPI0024B50D6B|nr:protein SCAF11 [Lampris incognitus]